MDKIVYGETSYDELFDIVDSLDEELEHANERIKVLEEELSKWKARYYKIESQLPYGWG